MSVVFSEVDKTFNKSSLNTKERFVYDASQNAADPNYVIGEELKKLLTPEDLEKAKYKIEVIFPPSRKNVNVTACAVTTFKSGKKLHGGGDELLYLCRNEKDAKIGCGNVLKGDLMLSQGHDGPSSVYYCEKCKKYVNRELCASTLLYKLPIKTIAANIYKLFRQLDSNADIYLKYTRSDIRAANSSPQKMAQLPTKTEYAIYTLKNIIKDTSNDSQVINKIEAFLKA